MSRDILTLPPIEPDHRIAYGDGPEQFGDLRLPAGAGPHPLAIVVHGGSWSARHSLAYMSHMCTALRELGLATWSLEFRRVGSVDGGWPNLFRDVARGADHVRDLAKTYPVRLEHIVATGHSSGGHLALWLASRGRIPPGDVLLTEDPVPIGTVVAIAPIGDLQARWRTGGRGTEAVGALMGGSPGDVPERYASGSPAELLPIGVRQRLVHGARDDLTITLSDDYVARARALGDDAAVVRIETAGHFEVIDPRAAEWPAVARELVAAAEPGSLSSADTLIATA
jgi:acetyl esterase/lipase